MDKFGPKRYSIEELIKIFKDHSREMKLSFKEDSDFCLPDALFSMCESIEFLLNQHFGED
jgi:hypothetical protein